MPQVSTREFEQLPLRVHTFLAGVPVHDVWSVDLPHWRAGVTLDDFLRTAGNCLCTPLAPCADAARHSVLRWTLLRLGSRARGNRVENFRNAFNRRRSFEITDRSRYARRIFPRRLPFRKRAARRADQSNSPRCGAERPGRDSDCLPVLLRGLCPQRKPLHAVLHGIDRPFSETDRLSVALAQYPCSLESSVRHGLMWRYASAIDGLSREAEISGSE